LSAPTFDVIGPFVVPTEVFRTGTRLIDKRGVGAFWENSGAAKSAVATRSRFVAGVAPLPGTSA